MPNKKKLRILVIRSHILSNNFWGKLRHCREFGPLKLKFILHPSRPIRLRDLEKSYPDIIVFSDAAGATYRISDEEIADLETYLRNGRHHLLATYATFFHTEIDGVMVFDNRKLAPFFGLSPTQDYTIMRHSDSRTLFPADFSSRLWEGMELPYRSLGHSSCQVPKTSGGTGSWVAPDGSVIGGEREGLTLVASTEDNTGVALHYRGPYHSAMYISHMPEYSLDPSRDDMQFIYNCFAYLHRQGPLLSLQNNAAHVLCTSKRIENFDINLLPPDLLPMFENILRKHGKRKRQKN